MEVFVARQPIFDRAGQVCGYELLFRSDDNLSAPENMSEVCASAQVISNTLFSIGIENLLADKPAFINFGRDVLLSGIHSTIPPEDLVIEILETVPADDEVLQACRAVRDEGYRIALDDFVRQPAREPLTALATVIKVDVLVTPYSEQVRLLQHYRPLGIKMLAEKVETEAAFEQARNAGYDLFQGYFFARPHVVKGQKIPAARMTCLRLLAEMQNPSIDFHRVNALVSRDVSLSYGLLLYVNSALFSHGEVRSIEHALALLGQENIRHWVVLATLPILAKDKPGELVTLSLVRARFCEDLAYLAGTAEPGLAFLMGLFSLLEALTAVPLNEALTRINVDPMIRAALTGAAEENDPYRLIYQLACRYEEGDWDRVIDNSHRLRICRSKVAEGYAQSILWAKQALNATSRITDSRRQVRYPAKGTIRIRCEDQDGTARIVLAQITNASAGGVQLCATEKITTSTRITCNDPVSGIAGEGCVRYCNFRKGKYVVGVEFHGGSGWRGDQGEETEQHRNRNWTTDHASATNEGREPPVPELMLAGTGPR
ncbi:MAG: EAL domain-containing protein [Bryobacteraceae bacterium]